MKTPISDIAVNDLSGDMLIVRQVALDTSAEGLEEEGEDTFSETVCPD